MGHDFDELKGPWYPTYLVRPDDHAIFEIDRSNMCYRLYEKQPKKNRPTAYKHFTYDILTKNYGWYAITKEEIPEHEALNDRWCEIWLKCHESDGHGGIKGRKNLTPEEIDFIQLEQD